jgi:hypothetical protein
VFVYLGFCRLLLVLPAMKASACWLGLLASFCFDFRESVPFSQGSLFLFSGLYMPIQLTCWFQLCFILIYKISYI